MDNTSDDRDQVEGDVAERIERVRRVYERDHEQAAATTDNDDELCMICTVVTADRVEWLEADESGRMVEVALCQSCWEKIDRYSRGEEVDFTEERRLHTRLESDS